MHLPFEILHKIKGTDEHEDDGRDPGEDSLVETIREIGMCRVPRLVHIPELAAAKLLERSVRSSSGSRCRRHF